MSISPHCSPPSSLSLCVCLNTHRDLSTYNSTQAIFSYQSASAWEKLYDVMCVCVFPLSPAVKKEKN